MNRLALVVGILVSMLVGIRAQNPILITTERGLSNSLVNQVYQDSRGYVWITTEDGLNRFDGTDMVVYHTQKNRCGKSEGRLNSNYVHKVFEDSSGRLWIGTMNGLQKYNREKDIFEEVPIISKGVEMEAHVTDIAEDQRGRIWIATSGRGVLKYVEDQVLDTHLKMDSGADYVSSMICDKKGYLWVVASSNKLVYRYNVEKRKIEYIKIDSDGQRMEDAFVVEANGDVYLSADNGGLYKYDEKSATFKRTGMSRGIFVSSILAQNGSLYIGTDGDGLYKKDLSTGEETKLDIFIPQIDFGKAKIHSILFDRNGNMWLGVFQKGVVMIPKLSTPFDGYGYKPNSSYNIGSASVMSVMRDVDGIWIGTDGDGMYYVRDNGTTEHIAKGVPSTVMGIAKGDDSETLMLAGYDAGLVEYNKRTHQSKDLNSILLKSSDRYNGRVVCVEENPMGGHFVGTYGSGVYKIAGGTATAYISLSESPDFRRNEPINNWINSIVSDGYRMWMGTYKGLCCYDAAVGKFVALDSALYNIVKNKVVYHVATDEASCLWMATSEGLIKYDPFMNIAKVMGQIDGLATDVAVGIAIDKSRRVWVSTNKGLSRYDERLNRFNNFYAYDGLQGDQFSRAAVSADNNGRLYFGGTNGMTSFMPSSIIPDSIAMRVEVTRLHLDGREVRVGDTSNGIDVLDKYIMDADKIVYSYADKTITLDLSTFNFVNPELVNYEYKLEGFDTNWHSTANGVSQISYSNLKPGDYKLYIKSKLGGNISHTKTIDIEIRALWWQTKWAIMLYVIIIIMAIFFIIISLKQRAYIKRELLRQEYERNIEEEKFQFFFNISHEIRTPLTLIINPIKELLSQGSNEETGRKYEMIYRNSLRILHLINQLLDMRKIEKGQMKMSFKVTDLKKMIEEINANFEYVSSKKKIAMPVESRMSDTKVAVDRDLFDKVMINLYSNALKFTPERGEIKTTLKEEGENIVIEVADTGNGIAQDKLERIFDRFYQIENSETAAYNGTGIGLHFTRSVVEMHNGTIEADNRTDGKKGAIFRVVIPRHQEDEQVAEETSTENVIEKELPVENYTRRIFDEKRHRATTKKRILVVDDEPEVNSYLVNELSKHYKVNSCMNGKDAYDMLLKDKYDAVVSDVMMPEMDGMTLCKKVKSNININHIPVILLTAKHSDEDRNKGLILGADAYIAKPFDIEVLNNTLWSIMENRDRVMSKIGEMRTEHKPQKKVTLKSADEALMEKVTAFIDANISDSSLNVEKLADHVGMSRVHMHRKLKELTNQSARDFIKNIRLKQAGILLCEKKLNISDVAYALGFTNLSHFSTSFKDFYGVSPKEYMNERLENAQEPEQN